MNNTSKKKVNGLLVFSVCLLVLAIVVPITYALFTDVKTQTTQITFGKIEIDGEKTLVSTAIGNVLPGMSILEEDIVVAKDIFSESYILRAKHTFGATGDAYTAYNDILSGESFQQKDGYGYLKYEDENWYTVAENQYTQVYVETDVLGTYELANLTNTPSTESITFYSDDAGANAVLTANVIRKPLMANGFILVTQAVDSTGNIWASTYNRLTDTYTLEAVDVDGTDGQDTAKAGYAQNYRWFYNTVDEFFYLAEYFTDELENKADVVRIKNVVKNAPETDITGNAYDLTTKAGRTAFIDYYNNTYQITVDENATTLGELKDAMDDAKEDYTAKKTAYNTAYATFNSARSTFTAQQTAVATAIAGVTLTETVDTTYVSNYNTYNDAIVDYINNGNSDNKDAKERAITNAKTALDTSLASVTSAASTITTAVADYITAANPLVTAKSQEITAFGEVNSSLGAYRTAVANYSEGRDLIAAVLTNYQKLYVFGLGGDYSKIPTELYPMTDNAQFGVNFIFELNFEAVQSANLVTGEENTPIDITAVTIASLSGYFPTQD